MELILTSSVNQGVLLVFKHLSRKFFNYYLHKYHFNAKKLQRTNSSYFL